jgi:hypothetical protein
METSKRRGVRQVAKAKLTLRENDFLVLEVHDKGHVSIQETVDGHAHQPVVMNAKKAYKLAEWLTEHAGAVEGDKATYDPAEYVRKNRDAQVTETQKRNRDQYSMSSDKPKGDRTDEETAVLEAVTPTPRPTKDIAAESGVSKIATNAILKRFAEAGKVTRGEEEMQRPYMGHTHRAVWSLPGE